MTATAEQKLTRNQWRGWASDKMPTVKRMAAEIEHSLIARAEFESIRVELYAAP